MRIGEGRTEARSSICAVTSESRICRGCSTRSFEAGCSTTGGFTGRRSIRRCANWTDRWPAGPIGNTRSCADICEGRRIGSRVSRDAIRSCGRTGKWVCGVAPWREPYERRRSSTVLREPRGETPRAYSPQYLRRQSSGGGTERVWERKFLGFRLDRGRRIGVAPESVERFKTKVREMWRGNQSRTSEELRDRWASYARGWWGYFRLAEVRRPNAESRIQFAWGVASGR